MSGLKPILDRLGLTQAEFARLLDVSPRTVSFWSSGDVALPGPVKAYLRMLQFADDAKRTLELARLGQARPQIDEGIYSLRYAAADSAGEKKSAGDALALVRAGRIVGSDAGGGKFRGSYVFDSGRQTYHLKVWFQVPPSGELITGLATGAAGGLIEVVAEIHRPGPFVKATAHANGQPLELTMAYLGPMPS